MRIAIDISAVVYGTGVSVYTKELVRNLLKIDTDNEYLLFGGSLRRKHDLSAFLNELKETRLSGKFEGAVYTIPPTVSDILWNRFHKFPIERLIGKVNIFHSSDWTQPSSSAFKVTTVHDLAPFKFPELNHSRIERVHKRRLEWVKKEVDRVIVPSSQTKDDLIEMGFNDNKIEVIYEAASLSYKRVKSRNSIMRKYSLDKYMISVGVNPRKNTVNIIKAFEKIRSAGGGEDLCLVLVGHPHSIEVKESESVRFLGHVTDSELSALYSGAEALVYPSLYEGFGIPILEAMKVGTPVVTSNSGSLKETAGDAAVLVDPKSVDSIAKGIVRVFKEREKLISKGYEREKQFSWQKMARETLAVYNSLRP